MDSLAPPSQPSENRRGTDNQGPETSQAISIEQTLSLNELVAKELAKMQNSERVPFPNACRCLLQQMEGNEQCIDCGISNPEWAAVTFGALICLVCSGKHRSLGVNVSTVRSVRMDHCKFLYAPRPSLEKMLLIIHVLVQLLLTTLQW
jgi:hypothetical protein